MARQKREVFNRPQKQFGSSVWIRLTSGLLLGALLIGCGVELPGLEPPTDTLYYPSSTTDLGNGELLIVNGNFDLRFKTAWLNVLDLDAAIQAGRDEAPIESYLTGEELRILSHPGRLSLLEGQVLLPHRGANHRGEALVSSISIDQGSLLCGAVEPEISGEMTTLEKATGCDETGLIRLMPDGSNEQDGAVLADESIFEGAFEGAFHAEQFLWDHDDIEETPKRRLAAVAFLNSNWLWLFELLDEEWQPIMVTLLPSSATGDVAFLEFNGKEKLLISGRGSSTTPGRFLLMDITDSMESGQYEGESFPFSDGLLARESVRVSVDSDVNHVLALSRNPDGIVSISLDPETRIEGDQFREVPSFDLVDFAAIEGRVLDMATHPVTSGSLIAVSSYGEDRLWVAHYQGGRFEVVWEWDFSKSDGYTRVQGPFGVTWVQNGDSLYLINTHFEAHAISIFDFSDWESRQIDRVVKLYSERMTQR